MTSDQRQSRPKPDRQVKSAPLDLGKHVTSLLNVLTKLFADEVESRGISPVEYSLLRICLERGECTATEIAEELPVDASRISRIVNRLVDDGMLVRRRLRDDRRVIMLRLSDQGHELISLLFGRLQAHYAWLTEDIDEDDIRTVNAVAARILDKYAAMELS